MERKSIFHALPLGSVSNVTTRFHVGLEHPRPEIENLAATDLFAPSSFACVVSAACC